MKKTSKLQTDNKQAGYPHENPEHPQEFGHGIPPTARDDHPGKPDRDEDESHEPEEFIATNPNWRGKGGKDQKAKQQ